MTGHIREIAIIGAGHGGFAAAADLTLRGFSVRLYGRSLATIAPVQARGGIELTGALGEHFAPLPKVTNDAGEAICDADLVVMVAPTHAHGAVATTIAPHLTEDQVLLAAPGHTVLLIPDTLRRDGCHVGAFCDTASLPYIARKSGPAAVHIAQAARYLMFAAFPGTRTAQLAERLRPVYPAIQPGANLLATVFPYANAIHHPPAILYNAGRVEATRGDYYHYYDGISPAVGRLIDALDAERLAVAQALGVRVLPFVEQFHRAGYTTEAARATGLAYEAFHQSEPDRWIRAPASLDHRFLDEDVPYGLVPLAELARFAGVATPAIEHLIHLCGVATGKDYRAQGLTLERLGLAGYDAAHAIALLDRGYVN
jgi:opine dehydrogenase